jgi:hypothetical protein
MNEPSTRRRRSRRGSVYLALLICSMIVTVIGLSALSVTRIRQRTVQSDVGLAEARLHARSALELGLLWINTTPNWRTKYPNGDWVVKQPIGGGTFTLNGVDPVDGNLANSTSDPVVLTGTGEEGNARFMLQVRMQPQPGPIDALKSGLVANGQITVSSGRTLTIDYGPVTTNSLLQIDGAVIGDVQAAAVAGSGLITDPVTSEPATVAMPTSTVVSDYAAKGVTILKSGTISGFVLGPGVNPWGATNADGVYVIDTQGSDLTIQDARVSGTLVIKAAGRKVTLRDAVFFKSVRSDYPALIVEGNLDINLDSSLSVLSEPVLGINLNPIGAPLDGLFNNSTTDTYPKEIDGLVHVLGTLNMLKDATVKGAIICEGTVTIADTNHLVYDRTVYDLPPVGYTAPLGRMAVVPGSWQQVTLP